MVGIQASQLQGIQTNRFSELPEELRAKYSEIKANEALKIADSFDSGHSVNLGTSTFALPVMEGEATSGIQNFLQGLTANQQNNFQDAANSVGLAMSRSNASADTITTQIQGALPGLGVTSADDVSTAAKSLITAGIGGYNSRLQEAANITQAKQTAKKDMRDDITELQDIITDGDYTAPSNEFTYNKVTLDDEGKMTVEEKTVTIKSEKEATALMEELEGDMTTLSDFTDFDMYNLQQMIQDRTKAESLFSSILDNIDKNLKTIINNLKA